jgi:hypothetical protein
MKATAAVVREPTVLIDDPKKEVTRQKGWRLRASLVDYIERRSKDAHRGAETQLVEDAISLHATLHDRLGDAGPRLRRFAADSELDFARDSGEVIARLVLAGLDAHERAKKK